MIWVTPLAKDASTSVGREKNIRTVPQNGARSGGGAPTA